MELSIKSPYPKTITTFDNERSFPDVVLMLGEESGYHLHRRDLSLASTMLCDLFTKGAKSTVCDVAAEGLSGWMKEPRNVRIIAVS